MPLRPERYHGIEAELALLTFERDARGLLHVDIVIVVREKDSRKKSWNTY